MNSDESLHNEVESGLDDLNEEVEMLASFGREDKKKVKNILTNEYISLCKHFKNNPVPIVYQKKELDVLMTKISNHTKDLVELRKGYQKVTSLQKNLQKEFNIAVKNSLAYKQLQHLIETMEMYLNYERIDEYNAVLQQFLNQKSELEKLPQKKAQPLIERIKQLKQRSKKIESTDKLQAITEKLEELLMLEWNILNNKSREIDEVGEQIDEIISTEFQENIRQDLLTGVQNRLLNQKVIQGKGIEKFEKVLAFIKDRFREKWKDEMK